jgi:hypothetical protein
VIAEIDGNTVNGMEVAIGGNDGNLYVYGADGSLRWSVFVLPEPCSTTPGGGALLNSKPAVGAIYGNDVPYVVVTYGPAVPSDCDGGVAVYDGATGALDWRFSLAAWEQSEGYSPEGLHGVLSSPALADTHGDGTLEIAFGGFDRNFYLLNSDGSVRFYYHAADTIWSSPAFIQLDDDGPLEIVFGTDITANPLTIPPESDGGYVYAFDTHPRTPARLDYRKGYIWRTPNLDQVIYSSPAIGDVLPSNPGDEIVIGSGCGFPLGFADKEGKWVKILRPADGEVLQTLNVPPGGTCTQSSAALGDIDEDGLLEIVFTMGSGQDTGGDGLGRVVAWDPENPTPKWSVVPYSPHAVPEDANGNDPYGGDIQSPVIADVDGNGSLEVLAANFWSVHVFAGSDGTPLTCQDNACGTQTSLFAWGSVKSTPAVGDVDGDGDLEVFLGGMHVWSPGNGELPPAGEGLFYAWTDLAGVLASAPGAHPAYTAPWPQFHANATPVGAPGDPPPDPSDACDPFVEGSYDHVACEIEAFLEDIGCELPMESKILKAAGAARAAAQHTKKKKVRKLNKKARKRLMGARKQVDEQAPIECQVATKARLFEFVQTLKGML